jgi:hypothetical protein
VNTQTAGPAPKEFMILCVWDGTRDFAFPMMGYNTPKLRIFYLYDFSVFPWCECDTHSVETVVGILNLDPLAG